jgi:chromosome segregation ATPase
MNGVNYQATGGAPAPPARDWRDGFAELERARAAYQQALRSGDVSAAEALAGEVSRLESTLQSEIAPLAGRAASHTPRPPAKGEETKLRKRLASVTKEIEKLESERAKLLVALAGEDSPDFQDVTRIDYELSRARYASEALQARLAEIAQYHADQERRRKLERELAERRQREAELKQATEALDKLADEAVAGWQRLAQNVVGIEREAAQHGLSAEHWIGAILERCGARRSPVMICGIVSPIVFPWPEVK